MKKHILFLFLFFVLLSFSQEIEQQKKLKRYIRPSVYIDIYTTNYTDIKNLRLDSKGIYSSRINKRRNNQESYAFRLINFGFTLPVFTKTWENEEKAHMPTFNLIFTGNGLIAKPMFAIIENNHRLQKIGLGLRAIYTDGKKSTFFVNFSPFISQDQTTIKSPTIRFSASFVYNYTFNKYFSFRVGLNKSYLLAELGYYLPFIGFRAGKLDGIYFSFQLPRNASLNFPIFKNKIYGSVFFKPIGGIFNYDNTDENLNELLPNENLASKKLIRDNIQFRFNEFLLGFLSDFKINQNISFYASVGFSTNRNLGFAIDDNKKLINRSILKLGLANSLFLNFGATFTFGQAKKTYNNYQMQDAFYINNSFDAGDINLGNRELNIQNAEKEKVKTTKTSEIDYKDIKDLIYDVE